MPLEPGSGVVMRRGVYKERPEKRRAEVALISKGFSSRLPQL
jgi:hypothetical protein